VTKKATMSDVLRVHDYKYLKKVQKLCSQADNFGFTKLGTIKYNLLDRDTSVSQESWECALLSCGAVIEAVDKVMSKQAKNAFCAIRPPGHHAGIFGQTIEGTFNLTCND